MIKQINPINQPQKITVEVYGKRIDVTPFEFPEYPGVQFFTINVFELFPWASKMPRYSDGYKFTTHVVLGKKSITMSNGSSANDAELNTLNSTRFAENKNNKNLYVRTALYELLRR